MKKNIKLFPISKNVKNVLLLKHLIKTHLSQNINHYLKNIMIKEDQRENLRRTNVEIVCIRINIVMKKFLISSIYLKMEYVLRVILPIGLVYSFHRTVPQNYPTMSCHD